MARPSKLTPQLIVEFDAALRRSYFLCRAAQAVGVDRTTVRRWIRRGESSPASLHGAFCLAVKKALSDVEAQHVEYIAGRGPNWQASAWLLERRWPERWGSYKGQVLELKRLLTEVLRGKSPPHPA